MTIPPPPPPQLASEYILGKWRYKISSMLGIFASIYIFFFEMNVQDYDWANLDGFTIGKMVVVLIIIWVLSIASTSDSGLRLLVSITPTVILWITFVIPDLINGQSMGKGEMENAIVLILICATLIPAPIIYWILSRTSVFGHQCGSCSARGKLRTQQIDKRFLGTETITNSSQQREIHNKYLITSETTCQNCSYSFTTTSESREKAH